MFSAWKSGRPKTVPLSVRGHGTTTSKGPDNAAMMIYYRRGRGRSRADWRAVSCSAMAVSDWPVWPEWARSGSSSQTIRSDSSKRFPFGAPDIAHQSLARQRTPFLERTKCPVLADSTTMGSPPSQCSAPQNIGDWKLSMADSDVGVRRSPGDSAGLRRCPPGRGRPGRCGIGAGPRQPKE